MQKIFAIGYESNREFIRVVIFDDYIDLFHIDVNTVGKKTRVYFEEKEKALKYIREHKKLSIELVIYNKSMSCQAIPRKSVSCKEIRELAGNILSLQRESSNAVFYNDSVQKNDFATICATKLEKVNLDFINDIILEENQTTLIAWPVWIVSTYFQNFPMDKEKFHCALFSIQTLENCEIIAYANGGIICYRNGNIKFCERKAEIENTIRHIKKTHDISPDNIAIYSIDESITENLAKRSKANMSVICNDIDNSLLKYKNRVNKIIKVAFLSISLFFIHRYYFEILDIISVEEQIATRNKTLNSIDKDVLAEIDLWKDIDYSWINSQDFKILLKEKIDSEKLGKIQNAIIAFDENSKEVSIKLIPLEN